jgi:hypothetical protein
VMLAPKSIRNAFGIVISKVLLFLKINIFETLELEYL